MNRDIKIAIPTTFLIISGSIYLYARAADHNIIVDAERPIKMETNVMQSIGSQLLDCRIMRKSVICIESGPDSRQCQDAKSEILSDHIFDDIRNHKYDEIEMSIRTQIALESCKKDIGESK